MTSPAQKAAGKRDAATRAIDRLIEQKIIGEFQRYNMGQVIRVEYEKDIQQAITEAVDAAVASKEKRVKELEAALKAIKVYGPDADGIVTLRWTDYAKDERHGKLPIAGWVRIRVDTLPGKELLKWAAKASAALEAPHEP